jgi:hypothetical protein
MMTKTIKDYLETIIPQEQRWKIALFQNWETIMGPLKDKVTIAQINNDSLLLKVIHPAWAQELFLLSSMLKQKINASLGKNYIATIRFVNSDVITKTNIGRCYFMGRYQKKYSTNIPLLNHNENAALAPIKNIELKLALELFLRRCKYLKGE